VTRSSGSRAIAARRQQRKPLVQSAIRIPVIARTYRFAKPLNTMRRMGQFTMRPPGT
jgi:hypothetical protein